ncbi:MAG: SDR family oxidoreductase [Acidimicrobiales bacterium]|nr:SDR family oxidoreductase [Acidimicrobiales bacterium]
MRQRRKAVITGASAGVGRATAVVFAQHGFDVALLARGDAGLKAAASEVGYAGGAALTLEVDVTDAAAVDRAAERAEAELGEIDVWVNNAMTTVFAPFWDLDPADFRRAVDVTFLGQVWGTMAALKRMRPRNQGSVVNVGSALAFVGIPLQSAYCASKFACRGFFESTRAELLHEHSQVRLSMVHLPAVNTPQFGWCQTTFDRHPQPVPPVYQPETAAHAILQVALDGRREKVLGSWNKALVFTDSLFRGVGDHYAALAAWESQLTDQPVSADRPANLRRPLDDLADKGAHGIFDGQAGGFWDRAFLQGLPKTSRLFAAAVANNTAEKVRTVRARIAGRAR